VAGTVRWRSQKPGFFRKAGLFPVGKLVTRRFET